jgi:hypothetical protein
MSCSLKCQPGSLAVAQRHRVSVPGGGGQGRNCQCALAALLHKASPSQVRLGRLWTVSWPLSAEDLVCSFRNAHLHVPEGRKQVEGKASE